MNMKKTALLSFILVAGLTSCKKDRVCTCTYPIIGEEKSTYTSVTKGQAKANCVSYTYTEGTYTGEVTCKLD